jgi:hypothetical protein
LSLGDVDEGGGDAGAVRGRAPALCSNGSLLDDAGRLALIMRDQAVGVWLPRLVWVAAIVLFLVTFVKSANAPAVDFTSYYSAGQDIRTGGDIYAQARVVAANQYAMFAPNTPNGNASAYVYPPLVALAMAPLSVLPFEAASLVWYVVLTASVLLTAYALADVLSTSFARGRGLLFAAILIGLLLFKPVRGALGYTRQIDVLLLMLLAVTFWAFTRRRDVLAGVFLGLAIAIKPFFVVIALFLLWKGSLRGFIAAGVTAAVLGLGPLVAMGQVGEYLSIGAYWSSPAFVSSPVSQSFTSLVIRLFAENQFTRPVLDVPWLATPLRVVYSLGVVGLLLWTVTRSRGRHPIDLALEFGLIVAATLLVGPLAEESHLAYLAMGLISAGAAAAARASTSRSARWLGAAVIVASLGLLAPGLHELSQGFWRFDVEPLRFPFSLVTGTYLYIQLALAALLVVTLRWWRAGSSARA